MAEYLTPGVFVEDITQVVDMPSGTVPASAFVGVAKSGPVGVPVAVTSWNMYLNTFAGGQESAFLTNNYLAYAVYGFFQNGGKLCYVLRVSSGTVSSDNTITYAAKPATSTGDDAFAKAFSAKYEGDWGNKLKIKCPKSGVNETLGIFTLQVLLNDVIVESWANLGSGVNVKDCFADVINAESQFIEVTDITVPANLSTMENADVNITFSGGTDGDSTVSDAIYKASLHALDFYDPIRLVAIPGANSDLQVALAEYCTEMEYRIAICEGEETATTANLITLRERLNNLNANLYGPWIQVTNPLSSSGAPISIPACGHISGVYARISDSRGFWKAPAGTEAILKGAINVTKVFTQNDTDVLNPKSINALLPKPNYGVVIWGARSCRSDLPYASDLYTNITIKKTCYDLTQKYVFEPHDSSLWTKVKTTVQDYLNGIYQQGGFFGDSADQAYFVKCDEELNPLSIRNQGKLICEVGYATNKPAEFIIFRISHELTTA